MGGWEGGKGGGDAGARWRGVGSNRTEKRRRRRRRGEGWEGPVLKLNARAPCSHRQRFHGYRVILASKEISFTLVWRRRRRRKNRREISTKQQKWRKTDTAKKERKRKSGRR